LSSAGISGPSGPFIEAVSAAALTATAILSVAFWLDANAPAPPLPLLVLFVLIVSALVIALVAALIGLPLTWLLARRRWEAPWTYPTAGLIVGAAVTVGYFSIGSTGQSRPAEEWLQIVSFGAGPGLVCGALWWLLYRRHFQPGSAG
jgi:hypothetical protein